MKAKTQAYCMVKYAVIYNSHKPIKHKVLLNLFCITSFFIIISCSNKNDFNPKNSIGKESLTFNLTGIKEIDNMTNKMGNIRKNEDQITEYHQILESKKETNLEEINCIASISNSDIAGELQDVGIFNKIEIYPSQNLKRKISKKFAVTKMQNGKKYRILIFDESGNNFITKIDAIVGGALPRWENAKKNTTYKWIAYTFNDEEIPNFPDSPTASDYNLQISVTNGLNIQSLFWDEGTITTTNTAYSDNKSTILFEARHTVFQVKISGRAMYDKILNFSGKLEGLPLTGGVFDLKSGSYISKSPSSLTHIDFDIDDFYSSSNDTVFNLNLYSTFEGTIPATGIALSINEITFPTDAYNKANKTSRTINQTRTGAPLKFVFNLAGGTINSQFGKKTNILFDMSPPMIRINNEFYAFSNLFFDEVNQKYALRHYNTDIYDHPDFKGVNGSKQEYFNWKSLRPGQDIAVDQGDPCAQVYPKGYYIMPTNAHLAGLTNSTEFPNATSTTTPTKRKFGTFDTEGSSRIAYFVRSNNNFAPYSTYESIPFLQLGYRQAGNTNYALRVHDSSNPASAQIWSSQNFDTNTAYCLIITNSTASNNLSVLLETKPKNEGRQIRCMWTKATTYTIEL